MAESNNKEPFLSVLARVCNELTDVFNVGRVLSIGIPGAIAALPLLMIVSLISTPLALTPAQRGITATQEGKARRTNPDSATSGNVPTLQVTEQAQDSAPSVKTEYAGPLYVRSLPSFRLRIKQDMAHVTDWWFLWLLGTVMMGSVIGVFAYSLHGKKDDCCWTSLHLPLMGPGGPDVSYHKFLVREYWRFTEFAANFPLALIVAAALGAIYSLLLGLSYSLPWSFTWLVPVVLVCIAALMTATYAKWWFEHVVRRSSERYKKVSDSLIAGLVLFGGEAKTAAKSNGESSMPDRTRWLFKETALDEIRRAYVARFKSKACFTEITPACAEAWFSAGNALVDVARCQTGQDRIDTLHNACAKYESAIRFKDGYYDAFYNWARACALAHETNKAFEKLELLKREKWAALSKANTDDDFKTLHADPRWVKLF